MEVDGSGPGDGAEGLVATELERRAAGDGEGGGVAEAFVALCCKGAEFDQRRAGVCVGTGEHESGGSVCRIVQ